MTEDKQQQLHMQHYHYICDVSRRKDGCLDAFSSLTRSTQVLSNDDAVVGYAMDHAMSLQQMDDMLDLLHSEDQQPAWL